MYFGPLSNSSPLAMPIIGGLPGDAVPLGMLEPFREKAMLYYGRTLERLAEYRGLTAWEVLELIRTPGTMPPKEIAYDFLWGEVRLYEQCKDDWPSYAAEKVEIDYSDCDRITLHDTLAHLKYLKTVRREGDLVGKEIRPNVLYIVVENGFAYSFENGTKINRTAEVSPQPDPEKWKTPAQCVASNAWDSQVREVQEKIHSLYDAIKHGDEDHQAWLQEAIRCHFAGLPMPEYVAGKSSKYIHRPDEPFFVLLGRDPQAADLVEEWAAVRGLAEPEDWKVASARQIAQEMRAFKAANPNFGMSEALYHNALNRELQAADAIGQPLRGLYNEAAAEIPMRR